MNPASHCYRNQDALKSCGEMQETLTRYQNGENRTILFRDLVVGAIRQYQHKGAVILDIGCGHGFHGEIELQQSIADACHRMIGVEPDGSVAPPAFFSEIHRCTFDQAPISPGSVDVAYSVFVLEHIDKPALFWRKLFDCLVPGGVFWGFTVDSRHCFSLISQMTEMLCLKDLYMNWLRGHRAKDRYENYPVMYRANSPRAILPYTKGFRAIEMASMHRAGQMDFYFPRPLRRFSRSLERLCMALGLPGSILMIKLTK